MSTLFHIIAINERTGAKVYMTGYPMPYAQCCTMMNRISYHPARRIELEPFNT